MAAADRHRPAYTDQVNQPQATMPVSDAYLMDLQIEDLMYDEYIPTDEDFASLYDEDADLEAFSLECAFGPEE